MIFRSALLINSADEFSRLSSGQLPIPTLHAFFRNT